VQAKEVEDINKMALQQSHSSSAVVETMQNVSNATRRSSTNTRDAAQNIGRLARLVEQLHTSVEAFRLREDQSHPKLKFTGAKGIPSPSHNSSPNRLSPPLNRPYASGSQRRR